MVSAAKVTPRKDWTPADVQAFRPSVDASPWGLEGLRDVLQGAYLFEFEQGGSRALLALSPVMREHGLRLDVVGLVSTGDRMRSGELDAAVCDVARQWGARMVAMCTPHEHVAKQCERHGWKKTGVVMTKEVIQ